MSTTRVFKSGNSQAVRLPKEFRFRSGVVEIFRRGREVVLRERRPSLAELLQDLPPWPEDVVAPPDLPAQRREFGEL